MKYCGHNHEPFNNLGQETTLTQPPSAERLNPGTLPVDRRPVNGYS